MIVRTCAAAARQETAVQLNERIGDLASIQVRFTKRKGVYED
jgi:hypothetical protein